MGWNGIGPPAPSTAKGPSSACEVEDRRVEAAGGLDEDVGEAGDQQLGGLGVGPDRQAGAAVLHDGAQVVDAVQVVGVGVGVGDAVEEADAGGEELRAQVGGGVDQRAGGAAGPVLRSTRSEQRLRRLRGFAGSQSPQSPPMRGTPAEEPQPRMVARRRASCRGSGEAPASAEARSALPLGRRLGKRALAREARLAPRGGLCGR